MEFSFAYLPYKILCNNAEQLSDHEKFTVDVMKAIESSFDEVTKRSASHDCQISSLLRYRPYLIKLDREAE